jgi:regulatory protein
MVILAKKGKGNKIHISVDDEYIFTVDADYWFSLGISSGDEITDKEIETLKNAAGSRRAYNKALDLLSRRDYCEKELHFRLCRNFEPEQAEQAVKKVNELGLIDDEAYAQRLSAELFERKLMSPLKIRCELISKGISREIADIVCQGLDNNQKERIIKILQFKFPNQLLTEQGRRKAFNALVRLGYAFSDIRSAMRELDVEKHDYY